MFELKGEVRAGSLHVLSLHGVFSRELCGITIRECRLTKWEHATCVWEPKPSKGAGARFCLTPHRVIEEAG